MGSSGGTTEVRMSVHSRKSLYRDRFGSALPQHSHQCDDLAVSFVCTVLQCAYYYGDKIAIKMKAPLERLVESM